MSCDIIIVILKYRYLLIHRDGSIWLYFNKYEPSRKPTLWEGQFARAREGGASARKIAGRRSDALRHRDEKSPLAGKKRIWIRDLSANTPPEAGKGFKAEAGGQKFPPQPPSFLPALIRHGLEISILEFGFRKIL